MSTATHGLLAELDKLIVDDIEKKGGARFAGMDNKPALLRTYYAARSGGYEDDYIEKHEFAMLRNLFFFTKLWAIFQEVDSSEKQGPAHHAARVPAVLREQRPGVSGDRGPGADMFRDADVNDGGMLLFDEFCKFVADQLKRKGKHGSKNKRRDKRFGASKSKLKREAKRFAKCTADFAEMQLNKKSLARAWARRLQRQRHGQPRGDRQRDEPGLATSSPTRVWDLFYEFDSSGDRRLDLAEFARGCASLGIELSAKELIKEFDRIDENDGGLILFKDSRLKAPAPPASSMMRLPQELKGRVLDYLDLEAIMIKGGISRSFARARLPLLRAGGLPALEVFDFEVYDDNCVHTGDVALWPPQPRLKLGRRRRPAGAAIAPTRRTLPHANRPTQRKGFAGRESLGDPRFKDGKSKAVYDCARWYLLRGGERNGVEAKMTDYGLGLVASGDVAAGEAVLTTPLAWIVREDAPPTCRRRDDPRRISSRRPPPSPRASWSSRATAWEPYLAALPTAAELGDMPALWPDDEAAGLLAGTQTGRSRAELLATWRSDLEAINGRRRLHDPSSPELPWRQWRYYEALVMSRGSSLPGVGYAVLPFIDLANHDDAPNAKLRVDEADGTGVRR
ncbi:hypothetical protein JL720_13233 [Aureococcus anophagefferens]|nr:hypothetical protein JL720_13233 [Aureococcus anophagefferens]